VRHRRCTPATAEPRIRPYGLTGGRTTPSRNLRLESRVRTVAPAPDGLAPEYEAAVRLCRGNGTPIAEVAARLGLPAQVTKIIASDLIDRGVLDRPNPATVGPHDPQLLEAIIAHLKNL
jgi:DNA-directed RNA polymerase specialized sigma24 family protein